MVPLLERARTYLQKRSDERFIARRNRRAAAVGQRLEQLTQDLDINEGIIFSTAYRLSRNVPTPSDYEFTDAFSPGTNLGLNTLLAGLAKEGQELTPDILWTWVPEMDPNRKKRPEIRLPFEKPAEVVIVDFAKAEKRTLIPEAA